MEETKNDRSCCSKWGKRHIHFLLGVLIITIAFYMIVQSIDILSGDVADRSQITISAEGTVTAVPDVASLNLSVTIQGKTPKEVQDKTSEKMNKIIDFIQGEDVDAEDIKTLNLSINPRYYYPYQYPRIPCPLAENIYPPIEFLPCPPTSAVIIGYETNQTLQIKIRDLDNVGIIIDGAVKNGATQVSGISFSIDNPDDLKTEARELAFKKAQEKAESLAKIAGMKIKKVITFSESGGYIPIFRAMEAQGIGGGMDDIKTSVEPGSQEVTVNISVVFEVK